MMVVLVPFATMSQKRASKVKTQNTENTSNIKTNDDNSSFTALAYLSQEI